MNRTRRRRPGEAAPKTRDPQTTIHCMTMPKHFEYVFAAYSIWIGTFVVYLVYLWRRTRRHR